MYHLNPFLIWLPFKRFLKGFPTDEFIGKHLISFDKKNQIDIECIEDYFPDRNEGD